MLKNMNERKAFVMDYRSWGVYVLVPELHMRVFRKELPDGSAIYACEYKSAVWRGQAEEPVEEWSNANFQLVLKGQPFRPGWDSISTIIEHLMRIKVEKETDKE